MFLGFLTYGYHSSEEIQFNSATTVVGEFVSSQLLIHLTGSEQSKEKT